MVPVTGMNSLPVMSNVKVSATETARKKSTHYTDRYETHFMDEKKNKKKKQLATRIRYKKLPYVDNEA